MASKYFSALRVAEYELSLAEDRARAHGGPDAFSECMAKRAAVDRVKAQMEELVREKLVRGDVIAIGLKDGAGEGAENEVIAADFWTYADIDFEVMTARYRDQRYTSIHAAVYHPSRHDLPSVADDAPESVVEALPREGPQSGIIKSASGQDDPGGEAHSSPAVDAAFEKAKRKRGRPAKHPLAREAALVAMENVRNLCELPRTKGAEEVRRVIKNHPNFADSRDVQLSYDVIRREINRLCTKRAS